MKAAARGRRRPRPATACCSTTRYGRDALFDAARHAVSGSAGRSSCRARGRCASSSAQDLGIAARSNGRSTTAIKCLCFYHPGRPGRAEGRAGATSCARLFDAARKVGRELLIEIIAGKHGPLDDDTIAARARANSMTLGIKPDWWKLEPQASAGAWAKIDAAIDAQRSLLPRRRAARARSAAGRARGGLRRRRATRRSSRASRSAARSSPRRREQLARRQRCRRRGSDRRHGRDASKS